MITDLITYLFATLAVFMTFIVLLNYGDLIIASIRARFSVCRRNDAAKWRANYITNLLNHKN